jgi:hypothetical protein
VVTVSVRVGVNTTGLGLEFIEGDGGEGGHFVNNGSIVDLLVNWDGGVNVC